MTKFILFLSNMKIVLGELGFFFHSWLDTFIQDVIMHIVSRYQVTKFFFFSV